MCLETVTEKLVSGERDKAESVWEKLQSNMVSFCADNIILKN